MATDYFKKINNEWIHGVQENGDIKWGDKGINDGEVRMKLSGYCFFDLKQVDTLAFKDEDVVYSYDSVCRNFHIVPFYCDDNTMCKEYDGHVDELFEKINSVLSNEYKLCPKSGDVIEPTKKLHRYKFHKIKDEEGVCWEVLLSFNRLWCSDMNVGNKLGSVQFMKYSGNKGPNFSNVGGNGKFKMMYPISRNDGMFRYDTSTGHCVYNPHGLTIDSRPEDIAKAFEAFVRGFTIDGKASYYGTIDGRIEPND